MVALRRRAARGAAVACRWDKVWAASNRCVGRRERGRRAYASTGDLRFVLAVQRITNDLERVGDLAKGISKRVKYLSSNDIEVELPDTLGEMGKRCLAMLSDAVGSLADEKPEVLDKMHREDRFVDGMETEIFWWVQRTAPISSETTTTAVDILSIARLLERIADHCVNIAEDVNFYVSGNIVRHGFNTGAQPD